MEQTDDAVFLTRLDGTIAYVNPGFEKLYGYAAPEVLGQTPRILKSGEMSADHYAALWHTLLAGRNYRATHLNRARDGRLVTVDASITALRGPADELLGFVAVHSDISERRRLEEQRRALEAQLVRVAALRGARHARGGRGPRLRQPPGGRPRPRRRARAEAGRRGRRLPRAPRRSAWPASAGPASCGRS